VVGYPLVLRFCLKNRKPNLPQVQLVGCTTLQKRLATQTMTVWQSPQHPYHRLFSKASALKVVCFGSTEQFVAVMRRLEAFNSDFNSDFMT